MYLPSAVSFLVVLMMTIMNPFAKAAISLSDEESQLFGLVSTNDAGALKGFIESSSNLNINAIGKGGQTPLMFAVLSGKDQAVKVLLEAGADTTIGEQDGYTRE